MSARRQPQPAPPPDPLPPDLLAFVEALARADAGADYDVALAGPAEASLWTDDDF
ncbi:hypothetical protein [Phenylobacterium sp.]|uniref:hypothetical protein n=1 Tax=Phenylobacterium sp. TaxID=1871053 RepID=UPI0025FF0234|nr:hypothetical protein [Phenylobacterium sp.]MBX3482500.1 hypothetical protein [Phenylobacterium sp.]